MGFRIAEHTVERFLGAMEGFFPRYFVADMKLPRKYHQQLSFLFEWATWNIWWRDIKYDQPEFDIKDIRFDFRENDY